VIDDEEFNPLRVVNIDPVAISSRHLVRAPYSINEKQWLVSAPIDPKKILDFTKDDATPEKVKFDRGFLDKSIDASELFIQAFDWSEREDKKKKVKVQYSSEVPKDAVSDDYFPPCINNILNGMSDGKKRALFMLINFFQKCGYTWPIIKERLLKWNEKNEPQLRKAYIASQINWAQKQGGLMPPNCSNPNYKDIGVCQPDNFCSKIKNPVTYALSKNKVMRKGKKKSKGE
jgi:DNA primase large subunit